MANNTTENQPVDDDYQRARHAALEARKKLIAQLQDKKVTDKPELIRAYIALEPPYSSTLLQEMDYKQADFVSEDRKLGQLIKPFDNALYQAMNIRIALLERWNNADSFQAKDKLIAEYEAKKNKPPYISPLLHPLDMTVRIKPMDDNLIVKFNRYKSNRDEIVQRTTQLAAKVTPALMALQLKAAQFATRFQLAKQQLFQRGDSQSSRIYNQMLKANTMAATLYQRLSDTRQSYLDLKIDINEYKQLSQQIVNDTAWNIIEPAEQILRQHRRNSDGSRTLKQMAHDYLKSCGYLGALLAQTFFGTKTQTILQNINQGIQQTSGNKKSK